MALSRFLALAAFSFGLIATKVIAQGPSPSADAPHAVEIFVGYSYFSGGFAGGDSVPASNGPLNGWNVTAAGRLVAGLTLKVDAAAYYGNSN